MNDPLHILLIFTGGLLLGTFFFGGLWLTVKKTVSGRQPALWMVGSFLFRTGITLAGFYYIGHGDWHRLIICLLGFIIARLIIIWVTKKEVSHET
jgi:F1F0 ATPase subunit 2